MPNSEGKQPELSGVKPIPDLPAWASPLAQAAYAALGGGDHLFDLADGWAEPQMARYRDDKILALADFLRSGEEVPRAILDALANAIDPTCDALINLKVKKGRKSSISPATILNWHRDRQKVLPLYESYRQEGMPSEDCYARIAHDISRDIVTVKKMATEARAENKRTRRLQDAIEAGKTTAELIALIKTPLSKAARGRPRNEK